MSDQLAEASAMRSRFGRPGEMRQPRIWSRTDGLRRQFGSWSLL